ncbi:39S ribosomal protein L27, mitochondrial [Agrilus planipennis]|uniref:Large ribosomal subunit protein bL27m n=1 Tax=Agrilus planipennis TaxID=224129 RepID=A0A1W4XT03_AGRPL|nr:39S ribosomal protein L27, mitochondrial [Agrilus planipennis]
MNLYIKSFRSGFLSSEIQLKEWFRFASKKTGGSSRNPPDNTRPKHRGWKRQDGHLVEAGTILVLQRHLRFHPGLNVGLGRNGTLFAIIPGKVMVTCEKVDPDWEHTWIQRHYSHRKGHVFFKKYFNVIPNPQHQNFKLIDTV